MRGGKHKLAQHSEPMGGEGAGTGRGGVTRADSERKGRCGEAMLIVDFLPKLSYPKLTSNARGQMMGDVRLGLEREKNTNTN